MRSPPTMLDNQMSAPSGVRPAFWTSRRAGTRAVREVDEAAAADLADPGVLRAVAIGAEDDKSSVTRDGRVLSAPSKPVNRVNCALASGLSETAARCCHHHALTPIAAARTAAVAHGQSDLLRGRAGDSLVEADAVVSCAASQVVSIDHHFAHRLVAIGRIALQGFLHDAAERGRNLVLATVAQCRA